METRPILLAFNRGLVSKHALARVDLKRMALSAEEQTNWMPKVLGSMGLRAGTRYEHGIRGDLYSAHIPFVFAVDDTAIIELTDGTMRVEVNDALITRPAVTAALTNGTFDTDLTGWTDSDEVGATSAWATGGYLSLLGTGVNYAIRDQALTVNEVGVEHALNITIARGTVELSIGTVLGGTTLISAMKLREGVHSIAFTPAVGAVYIRLAANDTTVSYVDRCTVAPAGIMSVTTPWAEAKLPALRFDQSADVIFVARGGVRQQRIERQAPRSWSVVAYLVEDGPFLPQNSSTIRMNVAALTGNTTLTSSRDFFTASNVGSLFRLASAGQTVSSTLIAADTYTAPIRVTGVLAGRAFLITLTGTWVGTLTLQRSVSEPGDWTDVANYTGARSASYDDTLANQEIYYRIGIKSGNYTSGSCVATLSYAAGSIEGVGRVTAYTDARNVSLQVLSDFGSTSSTADWWEGAWSPRRGYPSAVVLHDGRLWWAGKDKIAGSVSDAFDSFDDKTEGDSGPIFRSIGSGPVDTINWLVSLTSLLVGGQGRVAVAKASSLDDPLTPSAFSLKTCTTLGTGALRAIQLDATCIFTHLNGQRVYELSMDGVTYNYTANDLTSVVPEIGTSAGFVKVAVQRMPDTRIHCLRADGTVAILVFDRVEKVTCWSIYETDGFVEDVVVTPSTGPEDNVRYAVRRVVNGVTKRFFERWALNSETVGATTTVLADAAIEYSGASTVTIPVPHLEGKSVVVWGNGKDLGTYVVAGGQITLTEAVTYCVVGLPYRARFKGTRFAEASEIAIGQKQQIHHVGLALGETHAQGLRFGQDFEHLENLPLVEEGRTIGADSIWDAYVMDSIPINGTWDNDTRLCLEAASPRPATVLAAIVSVTGHGK